MVQKPCPRCKKMMPYGTAYCAECTPKVEAAAEQIRERNRLLRQKQYNRKRNNKYLIFYRSKDWRTTSRAKLQEAGYKCEAGLEGCTQIATEVHHIKPVQTDEGWNLRLDWKNLEAVCTSCHNHRHPEKLGVKSDPNVIDIRAIERTPGGGEDSTGGSKDNAYRIPLCAKTAPNDAEEVTADAEAERTNRVDSGEGEKAPIKKRSSGKNGQRSKAKS